MKLKHPLLKVTAPALAFGLAFSGQAGAETVTSQAAVQANANAQANTEQNSGADISHRLMPVEKKVDAVENELASVLSSLEETEALTSEEYDGYLAELNSLLNRTSAATNQLNAVTKKLGEETPETAALENQLNETVTQVRNTQNLLGTFEIVPEQPAVDLPEADETLEEPTAPVENAIGDVNVPLESETGDVKAPVTNALENTSGTLLP